MNSDNQYGFLYQFQEQKQNMRMPRLNNFDEIWKV